ncbi:pyridoxamine 5'-phosphate oxidase [Vallicoccus soli]|uniref:Pyridoxine/pyridoxamine 5'-phosphate oxidase n=1 Tax=Vallicoccus soli TaxID=2339232 RepID=A0A3A3Z286_9ACTN|nr:pyridoxamine 5'-phosphate oxidase [Vallicoccus soli]
MRRDYALAGLSEQDLAGDPYAQFARWFDDAVRAGLPEPNAVVLATAAPDGQPSGRTVLLKAYDARGFVVFTNHRSRKGREVEANPRASLVFPWFPVERQVVVVGAVEHVAREETEAYFRTRPRGSQLGAWASEQSAVVASRAVLEERYAELERRFPEGEPVPVPPHWGGLRVVPATVEFWQGRSSRLHDRLRYRRDAGAWVVERLAP